MLVEVAGFALNAAVTPLGKPDAESVTPPLNLFTGVMVMVLFMLLPGEIVMVFGEGRRLKLAALVGQLFTRLAAFTDPMPLVKSQPVVAMYAPQSPSAFAGSHEVVDVESTPTGPLG